MQKKSANALSDVQKIKNNNKQEKHYEVITITPSRLKASYKPSVVAMPHIRQNQTKYSEQNCFFWAPNTILTRNFVTG